MKLIITITAMLFVNLCAFAQTNLVRTELNYIFQNIDKTQIPTGYLNEYGPEVVYKKMGLIPKHRYKHSIRLHFITF